MDIIPPITAERLAAGAPFAIEPAMLTATNVAEPSVGEVAWTSGATFGITQRAIVGAPSATVTISIASPGVVTWSGHGLPDGTPVVLTTTGALPSGLTAGETLYVVGRATNTFQLAAEPGGQPIVTTGSQSGTHTATAHVHRTFESVQASNTGHPPAIDDGTWWIDVGPSNRWAMFDILRNTQTVAASPLVVTVSPGQRVDAIGLVGVVADEVTIDVMVDGETVYTYTQNLLTRPTVGWYSYFFGEFRQIGEVARTDLPPYTNAQITVTLTRAHGDVRCGGVVIGRRIYIGDVAWSPESDALNFSIIDRDPFGGSILVRRRSVPKTTQTLRCTKAMVNRVIQAREDLNAVPALWLGLNDPTDGYFSALAILGVYKRWLITIDVPDYAQQQLELEEV